MREHELPDVGDLWLADPETGRRIQVDTRRPQDCATAFAVAAAADRADVASEIASLGVDHLTLTTDGTGCGRSARTSPEKEAAMSFAWPLALCSLALIPLLLWRT